MSRSPGVDDPPVDARSVRSEAARGSLPPDEALRQYAPAVAVTLERLRAWVGSAALTLAVQMGFAAVAAQLEVLSWVPGSLVDMLIVVGLVAVMLVAAGWWWLSRWFGLLAAMLVVVATRAGQRQAMIFGGVVDRHVWPFTDPSGRVWTAYWRALSPPHG